MSVYILLKLFCLISCVHAADAPPSCELGELGQPYTFTCDVGGNHTVIVWEHNTWEIAKCDQTICNTNTHIYDVSVSGPTSKLTIRNVTTLDNGIYHCIVDENLAVYNFSVFGPVGNGSQEMPSSVIHIGGLVGGVVAAVVAIPIIICIIIRMAREGWCSPNKIYRLTHINTGATVDDDNKTT
ncbi:hypothetical protein BsWGS_10903 [Bradybaena similaris]